MPNFTVNLHLLEDVHKILLTHSHIFWVLGGAGAGKSTICRATSEQYNIPICDMDEKIYGTWQERFDAARHPANFAWHASPNGLEFLLKLSWQEFDTFNASSNVEYLDLFAQEIETMDASAPLLVDGGLSKPSILIQALPARQIACLAIPEELGTQIWETAPERQFMQDMVRQLSDGNMLWQKFLEYDRLLSRTMIQEARANGIRVFERTEGMSVSELVKEIVRGFGIG